MELIDCDTYIFFYNAVHVYVIGTYLENVTILDYNIRFVFSIRKLYSHKLAFIIQKIK